jgi:2-polyprenyl-6-methoxyphenol hydroxylase-like FAD-dependent oxidoreductase
VGNPVTKGQESEVSKDCAVAIVGGGPCGLVLAIELGRRGIETVVLEEKTTPSRFPSANATQARTMEHYRRLGFAEKVRAEGLPPDYPTDIAYFTRYTKYELARFSLPSARQAREIVRTLSGSWSAAELPHRVSQIFVEDVLRAEAAACPSVTLRPGWRMTAFRDLSVGGLGDGGLGDGVEVDAESADGSERTTLRAAYMLGADGGGSPTRKALGANYIGETSAVRDIMGGRMFAIHFRAPKFYDVMPHPPAWMYWAINHHRRAFMASVNGRDEFTFHTQIRPDQRAEHISDAEAIAMFHEGFGAPLDIELIGRSSWNAGYTLVAETFGRGRVFLGGDAAHLFTPTGGLGYNTAVEDAVNLGWKLAAVLKGWGGPGLLRSYELERQALAKRNTAYAAASPTRLGCFRCRRRWRTTARPEKRRARPPATTTTTMRVSSSTSPASPSAAATTARPSSCPTAPPRRPTSPTSTSPRPAPEGGRRTCGSPAAARSTTRSASSSRCFGWGEILPTPLRSQALRAGLAFR